jgi:hypothetical protein
MGGDQLLDALEQEQRPWSVLAGQGSAQGRAHRPERRRDLRQSGQPQRQGLAGGLGRTHGRADQRREGAVVVEQRTAFLQRGEHVWGGVAGDRGQRLRGQGLGRQREHAEHLPGRRCELCPGDEDLCAGGAAVGVRGVEQVLRRRRGQPCRGSSGGRPAPAQRRQLVQVGGSEGRCARAGPGARQLVRCGARWFWREHQRVAPPLHRSKHPGVGRVHLELAAEAAQGDDHGARRRAGAPCPRQQVGRVDGIGACAREHPEHRELDGGEADRRVAPNHQSGVEIEVSAMDPQPGQVPSPGPAQKKLFPPRRLAFATGVTRREGAADGRTARS